MAYARPLIHDRILLKNQASVREFRAYYHRQIDFPSQKTCANAPYPKDYQNEKAKQSKLA